MLLVESLILATLAGGPGDADRPLERAGHSVGHLVKSPWRHRCPAGRSGRVVRLVVICADGRDVQSRAASGRWAPQSPRPIERGRQVGRWKAPVARPGNPGRRERRAGVRAARERGLLIRSVANLLAIDVGVRVENVLSLRVSLPFVAYNSATSIRSFYRSLYERLEAIPGVYAASLSSDIPLVGDGEQRAFTRASGRCRRSSAERGRDVGAR